MSDYMNMKMNTTTNGAAGLTVTATMHLGRGRRGTLHLAERQPQEPEVPAAGRVPRVARLMALALRFEGLLARGEVRDYADLARLGHVTRARVTQVMNLLSLAPDLQEAVLFLPPVQSGRDPLKEWMLRPVAAEPVWAKQRKMSKRLPLAPAGPTPGRVDRLSTAAPARR